MALAYAIFLGAGADPAGDLRPAQGPDAGDRTSTTRTRRYPHRLGILICPGADRQEIFFHGFMFAVLVRGAARLDHDRRRCSSSGSGTRQHGAVQLIALGALRDRFVHPLLRTRSIIPYITLHALNTDHVRRRRKTLSRAVSPGSSSSASAPCRPGFGPSPPAGRRVARRAAVERSRRPGGLALAHSHRPDASRPTPTPPPRPHTRSPSRRHGKRPWPRGAAYEGAAFAGRPSPRGIVMKPYVASEGASPAGLSRSHPPPEEDPRQDAHVPAGRTAAHGVATSRSARRSAGSVADQDSHRGPRARDLRANPVKRQRRRAYAGPASKARRSRGCRTTTRPR